MGSSPTYRISPAIIRSLSLVIAKTKYIFQNVRAFCKSICAHWSWFVCRGSLVQRLERLREAGNVGSNPTWVYLIAIAVKNKNIFSFLSLFTVFLYIYKYKITECGLMVSRHIWDVDIIRVRVPVFRLGVSRYSLSLVLTGWIVDEMEIHGSSRWEGCKRYKTLYCESGWAPAECGCPYPR